MPSVLDYCNYIHEQVKKISIIGRTDCFTKDEQEVITRFEHAFSGDALYFYELVADDFYTAFKVLVSFAQTTGVKLDEILPGILDIDDKGDFSCKNKAVIATIAVLENLIFSKIIAQSDYLNTVEESCSFCRVDQSRITDIETLSIKIRAQLLFCWKVLFEINQKRKKAEIESLKRKKVLIDSIIYSAVDKIELTVDRFAPEVSLEVKARRLKVAELAQNMTSEDLIKLPVLSLNEAVVFARLCEIIGHSIGANSFTQFSKVDVAETTYRASPSSNDFLSAMQEMRRDISTLLSSTIAVARIHYNQTAMGPGYNTDGLETKVLYPFKVLGPAFTHTIGFAEFAVCWEEVHTLIFES